MKKYVASAAALTFLVLIIAGIALAKADVQKLVPFPSDAPVDPDASGKAVVNEPKGKVVLQVTVSAKGLEPSAVYTVYLYNAPDFVAVGVFTTNEDGEGAFHRNYKVGEADIPDPGSVLVNNPGNLTVLADEDYPPAP